MASLDLLQKHYGCPLLEGKHPSLLLFLLVSISPRLGWLQLTQRLQGLLTLSCLLRVFVVTCPQREQATPLLLF